MTDIEELRKTFEKRNFYTTKEAGSVFLWALVLPLLIGFAFCYISMFAVTKAGLLAADTEDIIYVMFDKFAWFAIPFILLTQISFVLIYFCFHKINRLSFKATNLHLKKINWKTALLAVVVGIVCVGGFIGLIEGCFGKLWQAMGLKPSGVALPLNTWWWYILNMIILGVVPAIAEELLFRGVIFQGLKEKFSKWPSILISALLFALIHQNLEQLIYPFFLGIVLAVTFERTNNLVYSILIHMFNNFTTITINFVLNMNGIEKLNLPATWWFVLASIAAAAVVFGVLFLLDKFYLKKHKKIEVEKDGEVVQARAIGVGNLPLTIIVGGVLAVVMIVINALG